MQLHIVYCVFASLCVVNLFDFCHSHSEHDLVLVISFDGFRWDYIQKAKAASKSTPNFDFLIQNGVSIKPPGGVKNTFTTLTFPNHYSLATGMYQENHGVVHNEMYDPDTNETFRMTPLQQRDAKWWNNGSETGGPEPIWITNEKDGVGALYKKRSGVYFWPGSNAEIHGTRPSRYMPDYDETRPNKTRIDTMLEWFSTDEHPINLGLLYFDQPDNAGHDVGPDGILDTIVALDELIGYLLKEMGTHHLDGRLNLIITSDHGMTSIKGYISLDDYLNPEYYTHYGESPVWHIVPREGYEQAVYDAFSKIEHTKLYRKGEIPSSFHYTYNKRIMPYILVAEMGYGLCHNVSQGCYQMKGDHGYSNGELDMQPFFIAHGPAFKKNFQIDQFEIVDIYPLLCHLLDLTPPPNDGSLERVEAMIDEHDNSFTTLVTFLISMAFTSAITAILCIIVCRLKRQRKVYVKTSLVMEDVNHSLGESKTRLLSSDEDEELP